MAMALCRSHRPGRSRPMNARYRSYTAYSIGVGVVWAVLLVLAAIFDPASRRNNIFLVFAGFAIGWLSATIARFVYLPPNRRGRHRPRRSASRSRPGDRAAGHAGSAHDPATCCREVPAAGMDGWSMSPERDEPPASIAIAGRSRPRTAGSPMCSAGTLARLGCRPAGVGFGWLNAEGGAGPRHVTRGHPVSH
jgi:hypothetical protein